ncbi:hypothetical protein Q1695_013273 [Nippostrongylus brasiliensis]|nr:hypothetical protein Q1695_013273 [Nippostrongylus brasiliensis]
MLIIYWLAVVFHISLAGQVLVPDEVETTTITTTRQTSPSVMPPTDRTTMLYTILDGTRVYETYLVANNRRTWREAKQHCEQNNLRLGPASGTILIAYEDRFRKLMGKKPDPYGVLWMSDSSPSTGKCAVGPLDSFKFSTNNRPVEIYQRDCNQTLGRDEKGGVLVGYVCQRQISYEAFLKGPQGRSTPSYKRTRQ